MAAPPANTDEERVPAYVLPDPLVCADGTPVRDAATWTARRRPELLRIFTEQVYGRTPGGRPAGMRWQVDVRDPAALGGKATRKEIVIAFGEGADAPRMRLLVYQPNGLAAPPPVFLGLNFNGNHTVTAEPGLTPPAELAGDLDRPNRARTTRRGGHATRWEVERVIARGYATATFYAGDLCPDRTEGLAASAARLFSATPGTEERAPDAWGAIGVWAWGLSRALDVLREDPELDARRVALHGHSRMGKAALWAGAQDERFTLVISNNSGCGGAALSKRIFGETVAAINGNFPYWFAKNFRRYDDREADLPVDQHELLALIAPRPLYVASAAEDLWADPLGEFLAARHAGPVYALFGRGGLGVDQPPPVDQPVGDVVRYHNRTGKHDITPYDWDRYLDFADRFLRRP